MKSAWGDFSESCGKEGLLHKEPIIKKMLWQIFLHYSALKRPYILSDVKYPLIVSFDIDTNHECF